MGWKSSHSHQMMNPRSERRQGAAVGVSPSRGPQHPSSLRQQQQSGRAAPRGHPGGRHQNTSRKKVNTASPRGTATVNETTLVWVGWG